jgi:light-regulated signal transduction histidine kinase (bacteriophytochrome)
VIISSGFGRLFVIIGPPFPKHSAGPVQMGRLTSDHSKAGGAGLGLAICREIISNLGGQISYLPGQRGAAFRVSLPRD